MITKLRENLPKTNKGLHMLLWFGTILILFVGISIATTFVNDDSISNGQAKINASGVYVDDIKLTKSVMLTVGYDNSSDFIVLNSTHDASDVVQNALNYLNSTGQWGEIVIKCGDYSFQDRVRFLGHTTTGGHVTIRGEGPCTYITKDWVEIGPLFALGNAEPRSHIVIKDFHAYLNNYSAKVVEGNNLSHSHITLENIIAEDTKTMVFNVDGNYIRFEGNKMYNVNKGIDSIGDWHWYINNIMIGNQNETANEQEGIDDNKAGNYTWIIGNYIEGFKEQGIDANHRHTTIIGNVVIAHPNQTQGAIGISQDYSVVQGNTIMNLSSNVGIELHVNSDYSSISNNIIQGTGGRCIDADGTNSMINNNVFDGCTTGVDSIGTDNEFYQNRFVNTTTNFSGSENPAMNYYNKLHNIRGGVYITSVNSIRDGLEIRRSSAINTAALRVKHTSGSGDRIVAVFNSSTGEIISITADDKVQVRGTALLQLNANSTALTCGASNAGALYYNDDTNKHYGCDGTTWQLLY